MIEELIEQIENATGFGMSTLKPKILSAIEQLQDEVHAAESHEEYLRGKIEDLEKDLDKAEEIIDAYRDFKADISSAMIELEDKHEAI